MIFYETHRILNYFSYYSDLMRLSNLDMEDAQNTGAVGLGDGAVLLSVPRCPNTLNNRRA